MPHRLIFVRHGIRGVTDETQEPSCLPFFTLDEHLALYGHLYSYKLGQFIHERYGQPTFIYGNIGAERTVSTTVAVAKGSGVDKIWLHEGNKDNFFDSTFAMTPEIMQGIKREVAEYRGLVAEIAQVAKKLVPCFYTTPTVVNDNGKVSGELEQVGKLGNTVAFAELSDISTPLVKASKALQTITHIKYLVLHPTEETYIPFSQKLLVAILSLLEKERLSIFCGHDTNISNIARYFDSIYTVGRYGPGFVPPNSGYVFTLREEDLIVETIWLAPEGNFFVSRFLSLPLSSDLIQQLADVDFSSEILECRQV